jgi:hypothetical protein
VETAQSFKHYQSLSWHDAMSQAYRKLIEKEQAFRDTDFTKLSADATRTSLTELEEAEREVMFAWAYSTRDINPSMLSEVKNNRVSLTRCKRDYIQQHCDNLLQETQ